MKRSNKKGFTIVELVIVIAIIAILAAVLIPTFASLIRKANVSKDTQLVRNLNTALVADNAEHTTMTDALKAAAAFGYDVGKINASATGNEILWDSKNDVFCYLKDGNIEYIPETVLKVDKDKVATYDYWQICTKVPSDQKYSIYWNNEAAPDFGEKNLTVGFDAGKCLAIEALKYTGKPGEAQDVVIRTNGISTVLTIDAASDNVDFYGVAKEIIVTNVKKDSLHIYGACSNLSVTNGHVKVESTGVVFNVKSVGTGATLTNNGYIAKAETGVTVTGTQVGGDYNIYDLKGLETFRDIVNAGGNDFVGIKVVLQKDIRLNDGWTPIGFGGRKGKDAKPFSGIFDGNNKTISNLNNKGYTPDKEQIYQDKYAKDSNGESAYAYGLFGLVQNATIQNLTLTDVDIDTTRAGMPGDSVAALVGYGMDNVEITGITVNGSVKAADAVAGVVGRVYKTTTANSTTLTIENCVNNAVITVIEGAAYSAKGAGIIGFANNDSESKDKTNKFTVNITNNTNNGVIYGYLRAAGVAVMSGGHTVYNISKNKNTASGTIYMPAGQTNVYAGAILDYASSYDQSNTSYIISENSNEAKVKIGETEQTNVPAVKYPGAN